MVDISTEVLTRYHAGERNFSNEDLSGLRLSRQTLTDCDFSHCMFSDCIIAFAGFDRSNFTGAEFEACNAIGASFVECNFTRGYLMDSAFGEADFFGAVFAGSRLTANFREAYFARSRWTDALSIGSRFDEAIFGFTVMHKSMIVACSFPGVRVIAPCDIDASTVSVSITANSVAIAPLNNKNDPDSHSARVELLETLQSTQRFFLLAGVERNLVQSYLRGMASLSRNYETAFISYSSEDEELAEKLWRRLQTAGIDTWFAPHNMQGGRTILEQISDAIDGQSKMILVLSVSSIRSNWVATEVRRAVNVERETGSKRLFPIRIVDYDTIRGWQLFDADVGEDLACRVREYYIPDFSNWKDPLRFEEEVTRLIADLQSNLRPNP